jgi:hypothetical protein
VYGDTEGISGQNEMNCEHSNAMIIRIAAVMAAAAVKTVFDAK